MELTVLSVPACPNAPVLEKRLAIALAGRPDVAIRHQVITSEPEAAAAGMRGSPTLLINGVDPFALPGQQPSLACRIYRDATGRASGAPPVEGLRLALAKVSRAI